MGRMLPSMVSAQIVQGERNCTHFKHHFWLVQNKVSERKYSVNIFYSMERFCLEVCPGSAIPAVGTELQDQRFGRHTWLSEAVMVLLSPSFDGAWGCFVGNSMREFQDSVKEWKAQLSANETQ